MLREEPADVFLRYSLALELNKEGRSDESIRWTKRLRRGSGERFFALAGAVC
jgi:hypothetical protein